MGKYNKKSAKTIRNTNKKFKHSECDNTMTFQECELAILRQAVTENEEIQGRRIVGNDDIKEILKIVEEFLIKKKLICYGGTAINNILPKNVQFYNKETEIPDYDFFSPNALNDCKELADIYYKNGYTDVEAKSGMHVGTYKVFVNFIPIADITQLVPKIYDAIRKETIMIAGINYAPPNYLRMSMYLELSRPNGDISRWEKVLKRLTLLNKYYPMSIDECSEIDFQRQLDSEMSNEETIYTITRDTLINQGVVFFGGYAFGHYSKYSKNNVKYKMTQAPDFDVLSEEPERTAMIVKEQLTQNNVKKTKIIKHSAVGEIIPERIEIMVGPETILMIYKPLACHSYNKISYNNVEINIATIDTILSYYLALIYIDPKLNYNRLLCMASFLFNLQEKNRLTQRGLLKRFTMSCFGKQQTLEDIRSEKAVKYKEFIETKTRYTPEYEEWFLKYIPGEDKQVKNNKTKTRKNKTKITSPKRPHSPPKKGLFDFIKKIKTH